MNIKQWILNGEMDEHKNTDTLLEQAGAKLDDAYAWDICGENLFLGEDGEFYVGHVEYTVTKADPDYVRQTLEDGTGIDQEVIDEMLEVLNKKEGNNE